MESSDRVSCPRKYRFQNSLPSFTEVHSGSVKIKAAPGGDASAASLYAARLREGIKADWN
jgi:hypothetical protein